MQIIKPRMQIMANAHMLLIYLKFALLKPYSSIHHKNVIFHNFSMSVSNQRDKNQQLKPIKIKAPSRDDHHSIPKWN